jgi:hypothetical protein
MKIRLAEGGRQSIPMQTRLAPVGTVDSKTRTAELVWSRGTRVQRYDWWNDEPYFEELSMDPAHVRMARMQAGAPLLNTHNRFDLAGVIGVVESAAVAGGEGRATVRFSERDDVKPIFQDVAAGIIRNVSVGYIVHKYEKSRNPDGVLVMRAVDWEPSEISLVPVGADAGAGVRSEQREQQRTFPCEIHDPAATATTTRSASTMKSPEELAAEKAAAELKLKQEREQKEAQERAAKEAAENERARVLEITGLVRKHGLDEKIGDELVKAGTSIEDSRKRVLDELAKKDATQPIRSGVEVITVSDETINRRAAMVDALMHRANPSSYKLEERAKPFVGYTLRELMRKCLELKGVRTDGMSVTRMWERTFEAGSDLPAIVLDAANKSLRAAYEGTPRTFVPWTRQSFAADFKNINRIQLSGAPALLQIAPGGEYKRGVVTDGKEVYALATYGRMLGINRQTIINDDMNAFTRLPALCARAAADMESDTVYGVLTANAALGVDNVALFHATHSNLTSSGTAIDVTALGVGRALMRKQVGIEGRVINCRPSFLIVPAAKETLAQQYTSVSFVPAQSSTINPFAQGKPDALTPIAEPRLDANSATAWYLATDPNQIDTIEYAYLEGQQGVYMESRMGWEVDGIELKVREDFAAKALDFRGLYKNVGA